MTQTSLNDKMEETMTNAPIKLPAPRTPEVAKDELIAPSVRSGGVLRELALTRWTSSEPHVTSVIVEPTYRLRQHKRASKKTN
jgi:hypothetical protein